jgi:hypothetical protein
VNSILVGFDESFLLIQMEQYIRTSVSEDNIREYHTKGFYIQKDALSPKALGFLRQDCDRWVSYVEMEMNLIEHLGCVIGEIYRYSPRVSYEHSC